MTDRVGAEYWLYQNHRHLWGIMKALEHGRGTMYDSQVRFLWVSLQFEDREILKEVKKGRAPCT